MERGVLERMDVVYGNAPTIPVYLLPCGGDTDLGVACIARRELPSWCVHAAQHA